MNTSIAYKKQKDLEKKIESLFTFDDDSENLKFEEMVINSNFVQVVKDLMKANSIKSRAELAEKMGVSPAYISKVFSSDKMFNVTFIAKLQRVFDTTFTFSTKNLNEAKVVNLVVSTQNENKEFDMQYFLKLKGSIEQNKISNVNLSVKNNLEVADYNLNYYTAN